MSTHSRIGYQDPNTKQFHSIYCHFDGYLSNNGRILLEHYQDFDKIVSLVALGDISALGENINPSGPHNYDKPEENVVIAYKRDRGETDVDASIDCIAKTDQEYNYYFIDGVWNWCQEKNRHALLPFTLADCKRGN